FENHIRSHRLESLDPAREFRRLIEKWRTAGPTDKGDRPANLARMRECGAAIDEDVGCRRNCERPWARNVFLLQVNQYQDRDSRGINICPNIDHGAHADLPSTAGLTARVRERSRIPGACQLPSGLMIT